MGDATLTPQEKGCEKYSTRAEEVRAIVYKLTEDSAWDHIQARDLDPKIIDFVAQRLSDGALPGDITKELGLSLQGGKNSRQWKKIAAYFRQGFRADAEAYLFQQTHKYYKMIEKAREVLEDAFENGVPIVVTNPEAPPEILYVKGATKELGSFLESYSKAIMLPPKLWKEFGAIGEKPGVVPGNQGLTIVVENNIPMPSVDQIKAHQAEMRARATAIEVKAMPVKPPEASE